MSRKQDTGLASIGQVLRRLLELHGVNAVALAAQAGVDLTRIPGPAERVAMDRADALLIRAADLIVDPAFGLQAARCWHPANLGVLGHAWLASSTLRTGLKRMARYWRIIGERAVTGVDETDQGVRVSYRRKPGNPAVAALVTDVVMSILLDMCRMNGGASLRPLAVSLRRGEPEGAVAYERFYGCPVRFGADDNAFVLRAEEADRPLPTSNRQLAAVFDRMLTEELARLDRSDVVTRCRASVLEHLVTGELSEEQTASRLHMSPRSLQRKLAEADTTYLKLVDSTRKDLALRYLEDPGTSITDITFSLGFSQSSAFTRAFRRWTGMAPSDYRAKFTALPIE